jgi:hypothetical protein
LRKLVAPAKDESERANLQRALAMVCKGTVTRPHASSMMTFGKFYILTATFSRSGPKSLKYKLMHQLARELH